MEFTTNYGYFLTIWILLFTSLLVLSDGCIYGSDESCLFPCRCNNPSEICDTDTGSCNSGCKDGMPEEYKWSGPGCRTGNIAYQKEAHQSGAWAIEHFANRATDGDTNPALGGGSCAHPYAAGEKAWWMVDLGDIYVIQSITVYNRDDFHTRLGNFKIYVGSTDNIADHRTVCGTYTGTVLSSGHDTINCNATSRYLSLKIEHNGPEKDVFALCEAVVIGYKPFDCTDCDGACDYLEGCSACPAGKRKPDCRRACQKGYYGTDCQEECGKCKNDDCDAVRGQCKQGCQDWWVGDKCDREIEKPSLANVKLNVMLKSPTSITVQWNASELAYLKEYVSYEAWLKREENADYTKLDNTKIYHTQFDDNTEGKMTITKLLPKTLYTVKIVPYRDIYIDTYSNMKREAGTESLSQEFYTEVASTSTSTPSADEPNGMVRDIPAEAQLGPTIPDNRGMIAGIAIGGLILIVLVILATLLFIRRIKSSEEKPTSPNRRFDSSMIQVQHDPEKARKQLGMADEPPAPSSSAPKVARTAKAPSPPVSDFDAPPPIPIAHLGQYIDKRKAEDNPYNAEYHAIPSGELYPCERGSMPENYKIKNRFLNIMAYDHSRVVLELENEDPLSDYVNANYLTGYKDKERAYVACQGPRPATVLDMWRLVWQIKTNRIVMVTKEFENGKRKCERYWPEKSGQSLKYGKIRVRTVSIEEFADFVIRIFSVTKDEEDARTIHQFHYTSWPDKRPPMYAFPLLAFRKKVKAMDSTAEGPMMVHCSAGVGRTGTFLSLDYLLQQAEVEKEVDVFRLVCNMRKQRVSMIQTLDQYTFVYDALLEAITQGDTTVPAAEFSSTLRQLQRVLPGAKCSKLEEQYQFLTEFNPKHKEEDVRAGLLPENRDKHRDAAIVTRDNSRPYLQTRVGNCTDYINAVFVHSYRIQSHMIATHMPLPHTVVDMWRLIQDHDCKTVIMLNEHNPEDETSGKYWPDDAEHKMEFGPLTVTEAKINEEHPNIRVRDMMLANSGQDPVCVRQFQVHGAWPEGAAVPEDPMVLCDLLEQIERWQQASGESKIIVHCYDGVSSTGVFCAAIHLVEKLRVEQEVDIFTSVKHIKTSRQQFVNSMEQYVFLHQFAQTYMDQFETYSNFK